MAVPRPILFALLGLALIAGVFVVTRQSSNGTVTAGPVPKAAVATPKPAPAPHVTAPRTAAPKTSATTPAHQAAPAKTASGASSAAEQSAAKLQPIATALAQGKVAVVLFSQAGSADDTGTTKAVDSLKSMPGVSIFTAGIADLPAFAPLISSAGVSQVPAVVVMRQGKQARVVQGFVDAATLRQTVTDAQG